jgi:hypothetical protein
MGDLNSKFVCSSCYEEANSVRSTSESICDSNIIDIRTHPGTQYLVKGQGWTAQPPKVEEKTFEALKVEFCKRLERQEKNNHSDWRKRIGIDIELMPMNSMPGWMQVCFAKSHTHSGLLFKRDHFNNEELDDIETNILSILNNNKTQLKKSTVEKVRGNRTTYSFGFREVKDKNRNSVLYNDVDMINKFPWLERFAKKIAKMVDFRFKMFNQIIIVDYESQSASLGVHCDDKTLVNYPIVTFRCFRERTLSFGNKGQGQTTEGVALIYFRSVAK